MRSSGTSRTDAGQSHVRARPSLSGPRPGVTGTRYSWRPYTRAVVYEPWTCHRIAGLTTVFVRYRAGRNQWRAIRCSTMGSKFRQRDTGRGCPVRNRAEGDQWGVCQPCGAAGTCGIALCRCGIRPCLAGSLVLGLLRADLPAALRMVDSWRVRSASMIAAALARCPAAGRMRMTLAAPGRVGEGNLCS